METIDNFSDESVVYFIQNNHENSNNNGSNVDNYQCTINPLEKYVEQVEKNEKLQEKNEALYQSLLKEKEEKIALLERLLEKK